MSQNDGLVVGLLRKVGGLLDGLGRQGVQQIELDRDGGVQHLKWSTPDLKSVLTTERQLVAENTTTGFRTALPAPNARVIDGDFSEA
jgi:hypothetical protein